MDTTSVVQAVGSSDFGTNAGYALMILAVFIGLGILYYGWPDFRRKR